MVINLYPIDITLIINQSDLKSFFAGCILKYGFDLVTLCNLKIKKYTREFLWVTFNKFPILTNLRFKLTKDKVVKG